MAHYTVNDVISAVREVIKDTESATWTDAYFLVSVRQAIKIVCKVINNLNPDILVKTTTITTVDGTDAYDINVTDFLHVISMSRGRGYDKLTEGNLDKFQESVKGQPKEYIVSGYYIESSQYTQISFDRTPDDAYTYTMRYRPSSDITLGSDAVPLPTFCREAIEDWVTKMALNRDEYTTMDENAKLMYVQELLGGLTILQSNAVEIENE